MCVLASAYERESSKNIGTTKEIGDFNIVFLRQNMSGKQCLVAHLCPVSHRHLKNYCAKIHVFLARWKRYGGKNDVTIQI
jgi:hypothetical protein